METLDPGQPRNLCTKKKNMGDPSSWSEMVHITGPPLMANGMWPASPKSSPAPRGLWGHYIPPCFVMRIISMTAPEMGWGKKKKQCLLSHFGPWNKSLNFIFPTKYGIPKSLKVSHWLNKNVLLFFFGWGREFKGRFENHIDKGRQMHSHVKRGK